LGNFFIPLEIFKREYEPKLVLALLSAKEGFNVIFGHKFHVTNLAVSKGTHSDVYLNKGSFLNKQLNILRDKSIFLVGYDEESGLAYNDYEEYSKQFQVYHDSNLFDAWLTWGPRDFRFAKQKLLNQGTSVTSFGTPRSIYWTRYSKLLHGYKGENEVESHRRQKVLICTNFAYESAISRKYFAQIFAEMNTYRKKLINDAYINSSRYMIESRSFAIYKYVIDGLIDETEFEILVRPHPVEVGARKTRELIRNYGSRVKLDTSYSSTESIYKSKAVLHLGSSVVYETLLADRQAISLDRFDSEFASVSAQSNSLKYSLRPNSLAELIGYLTSYPVIGRTQLSDLVWMKSSTPPYADFFDLLKKNSVNFDCNINAEKLNETPFQSPFISNFRKFTPNRNEIESIKRPRITKRKFLKDIDRVSLRLGIEAKFQCKHLDRSTFSIST
jgi:surface carbohydrate biosynthesis protein